MSNNQNVKMNIALPFLSLLLILKSKYLAVLIVVGKLGNSKQIDRFKKKVSLSSYKIYIIII